MRESRFDVLPGTHPSARHVPRRNDGARRATEIADHMLEHGVYVIAFSFPRRAAREGSHPGPALGGAFEDDVRACVEVFVAARDAVG